MTTIAKHVAVATRTRGADPTCDAAQVVQCERALESAQTTLMMSAPFYGRISVRMLPVANPRIAQGTAATDGRGLYFNPEWILKQTHRQLVGLLAHESMHVAHGHHIRRGDRNPRGWNVACDHVINLELIGARYDLPDGGLCDAQYAGMCEEEVYEHVYRPPPPQPEIEVGGFPGTGGEAQPSEGDDNQQQQRDDDAPESDDDDGTESDDADDTEEGDAGEASGDADTNDTQGTGDDEEPQSEEDGGNESLPAGGVIDALDPVQEEQELVTTLVEAGMCAKAMGKLPAHCARLINELTRAQVSWQDLLAEFLETNMREDYSLRRPNKRYMAQGVYLPSLRSEAAPELALLGDNSGSIDDRQFSRCVKAIQECVAVIRPERVHVMMCDSHVNYRATFERGEEVTDIPTDTGGGGTDFSPPFDALREEGIVPACAVYYTADADGWFGEEPEYPVLWLVEPGAKTPPWGRVVMLDNIIGEEVAA